uniref:Uncharacterized protein n=1 Tax=Ditylenchus dipsaci TaxID=166011 RepID=A0A915CS11_9BILA
MPTTCGNASAEVLSYVLSSKLFHVFDRKCCLHLIKIAHSMDYPKLQNCLGELRKGGANSSDEADDIEKEVKRGYRTRSASEGSFTWTKTIPLAASFLFKSFLVWRVVRSSATSMVTMGIEKAECLLEVLKVGFQSIRSLFASQSARHAVEAELHDYCTKKQEMMIGHIEGIHRQHTWLEGEENPNGQEQIGGFGQDAP